MHPWLAQEKRKTDAEQRAKEARKALAVAEAPRALSRFYK
jgi:hypothetical protein